MGTVEAYNNDGGKNILKGYRSAMNSGTRMSGLSAVSALAFIRVRRDVMEG